jgi:hypothetical protein
MAGATGANTEIGYIAEVVYGNIPVTPQLTSLPVASSTFTLAKDEIVDARLDGNRNVKDITFGNKQVSGDAAADFSAGDYDPFIESFMFNAFATNVAIIGTTLKSFTMEEAQLDIGYFRKMTGMVCNTMAVDAPIDGNATISFGFIGKDLGYDLGPSTPTDSLDGDAYTPATFSTPFRHVAGTILDNAGSIVGTVQAVSLAGDNAIDSQFVWGTDVLADVNAKKVQITGSLTIYYIDETLVNKFIQGTASALQFSLTDGTNIYTFELPKIYYTGSDMSVTNDGIRTITMPFRGVTDGETSLKISKSTT